MAPPDGELGPFAAGSFRRHHQNGAVESSRALTSDSLGQISSVRWGSALKIIFFSLSHNARLYAT